MRVDPKLLAVLGAVVLALGGAAVLVTVSSGGAPPAPAGPDPPSEASLPAPDAALPHAPGALAATLASTSAALDAAIDRWTGDGDPSRGGAPRDVALLALHQQRIYRLLARHPRLSRAVVARLPGPLRAEARDNVLAPRELGVITSVRRGPAPRIRVGRAEPAGVLLGHYRAAWRRFGVRPPLLAAVNFVESAFGRLRNRSISGAHGPMQFLPATWRAYGMGGDVRDPYDAILGAANLLHAAGAPGDERRALLSYNPSAAYASAVGRYARRIRADPRAFYAYYAWQVYAGGRRITAPPA